MHGHRTGDGTAATEIQAAWAEILDAVERALLVDALPPAHRRVLLRLRSGALRLARRPPLRVL